MKYKKQITNDIKNQMANKEQQKQKMNEQKSKITN